MVSYIEISEKSKELFFEKFEIEFERLFFEEGFYDFEWDFCGLKFGIIKAFFYKCFRCWCFKSELENVFCKCCE